MKAFPIHLCEFKVKVLKAHAASTAVGTGQIFWPLNPPWNQLQTSIAQVPIHFFDCRRDCYA
jgi:hypothetical protein